MNALDAIAEEIGQHVEDKQATSLFYSFEPWNVEERPQWIKRQAEKDGVDLYAPKFLKHVGDDPHEFQTGYLLSEAFFRSIVAGTSIGKSYVALMEAVIMITAQIPISLRYPKGEDTGVKRLISPENIRRFGRFDSRTGEFIDHDDTAEVPESWQEWDCGNIVGAGEYPKKKIGGHGEKVWIGTKHRALLQYWWPRIGPGEPKCIIPEILIDHNRDGGFSKQDYTVYLARGGAISAITYDSGYSKFEAERVHAMIFDEEPDDQRCVQAGQQRGQFFSLVMTPYNGITYTRDIVYPDRKSPEKATFHASQYDSPYQSRKLIETRRMNMNPWDISARVWGIYSEATGSPYFDRPKINAWLHKYALISSLAQFMPQYPYENIEELMSIPVHRIDVDKDDQQTTWRIYEEPKPGMAYAVGVDPAEGAAEPGAAGDVCAAVFARRRLPEEEYQEDRPLVIAATIRSTVETYEFARICGYAMRHYNNALLCAETKRAACNATFAAALRDWPFWYRMVTVQDSTRKPREIKGFDTNAATRGSIFDLITAWVNSCGENEHPDIPDEMLLRELAACVKGKKGRPDHTRNQTLDTTLAFGILLYVFKNAENQVQYFGDEEPQSKEPFSKLRKLAGTNEKKERPRFLAEAIPCGR